MPINEIMEMRGVGPSELARAAGLSRQALYQIRQGGGMSLDTAVRIACALDVEPASLLPSTPGQGIPRMGYRVVPIQGGTPDKPTFAEECMDTYPAVTAFHAAMTENKSVAEISRHLNNAVRELEEDMSSYMQQQAGAKG